MASSTARVRFSPAGSPDGRSALASSRVSTRSVCALPSNPPHSLGRGVERGLAVVPERRVPDVVGQPGGVDDVGVAAERGGDLAADLGDLERVGQPGAREVVLARHDDLGLVGQPAERVGVQHPGAVAGEVVAARRAGLGAGALGRLGDEPLALGRPVAPVVLIGHVAAAHSCSSIQSAKRSSVSIHMPTAYFSCARVAPASKS